MAVAGYFHIRGNSVFKHPFRRMLYEVMSRTGLLESGRSQRKARKPGNILTPVPLSRVYAPKYLSYGEEFRNIPDNTYIAGYWESERCFAEVSSLVRDMFKFPEEYMSLEHSSNVRSSNAVALHVRRGDKAVYGTREGYIKHAIEMVCSLTESPKFFVFSDDIEWCKKTLPQIYGAGGYTFIEGQTPAQDMALMTQCKHVIIGASTFSWWGAWLNDNPNKIVIAPDVNLWYKAGTYDPEDRKYLLPESWIKIV